MGRMILKGDRFWVPMRAVDAVEFSESNGTWSVIARGAGKSWPLASGLDSIELAKAALVEMAPWMDRGRKRG